MSDAEELAELFRRIEATTTAHLRPNQALAETRVADWKVHDTNEADRAELSLQIDLGHEQTVNLTFPKNGDPPSVWLGSAHTTGEFEYIDHRSFRKWLEIAAGLRPDGNICACCGEVNPGFFLVPDKVWQHYMREYRRELICLKCWRDIVRLTDAGAFAAKHTPSRP